ncbi:MAG: sel1 repeat family protein [Legionellales bacterium]|nr:sel1 repeat family protein [Legionellales bacterium]
MQKFKIMVIILAFSLAGAWAKKPESDFTATCSKQDLEQIKTAVKSANCRLQYLMGMIYIHGVVVKKDYAKALAWLKLAAENGDDNARVYLGVAYFYGKGVKQDPEKALYWFRQAAHQGDINIEKFLQKTYFNSISKDSHHQIIPYIEAQAKAGKADAQYFLGLLYTQGVGGFAEDDVKASYWFEKAAKQNMAEAQYNLAVNYLYGLGVKQDDNLAIYWFQKAATNGLKEAKRTLKLIASQ